MGKASFKRLFEAYYLDTIITYLYNAQPKILGSLDL